MALATISVIVPAAGCGARAALNGNKILAPLRGRPLLSWTLHALIAALSGNSGVTLAEVLIAARPEEFEFVRGAALGLEAAPVLVEGGATRQDSVHNAVRAAHGELVLVHDAARPCVSAEVVARTVRGALETGAAIAALPVSDTVKRAASGNTPVIEETLDRRMIWLAQTPQVFRRDLFLPALEDAAQNGWQGTDCASIMERAGHAVALVEGHADNLKVTYAQDLERAEVILGRMG